jgi:hypothetical protein
MNKQPGNDWNSEDQDPAHDFEQRWAPLLHQSLLPSSMELLGLYAGTLSDDEAEQVRRMIRSSPQAIREYAMMTDRSIDEVRAELQPTRSMMEVAASLATQLGDVVRRAATLLAAPPASAYAFRGEGDSIQHAYDIEGEPAATVLIDQAPVSMRRYRVSGQIIFDDETNSAQGEFVLTLDELPHREGEVSGAGVFDLGTLNNGIYRLELAVRSQIIDLRQMRVGHDELS